MKINGVWLLMYQRVILKDKMNMVMVGYGKEFVKILIELIEILKRENI